MRKIYFVTTALLFFATLSLSAQAAQTSLDNGKRQFDQRNYDAAIQELTEAIRLDPNLAEAYAYRSWAHGRKNNNAQALTDANEAIRRNPQLAMGYFVRGRLQSDNDRAIADYTEAIRLDPRFVDAYLNRGIVYNNKKDYDRAIADFTEAIRFDPRDAFAYYNRGNAYNDKKDYDRAIADFTEAIRFDPRDAGAYNNRGNAYYNKKDYDRAIADFTEAIRLDPRYAMAYDNRGSAYYNKGDYNRAIADYNEALRINPNYDLAKRNLANAQQKLVAQAETNSRTQNPGNANFGNYPADYGIAYFNMLGYSKTPTVRDLFGNNAPFLTRIQNIPGFVTIESGTGSRNEFTAVLAVSLKNEKTGESAKAFRMQVTFMSDSLTEKSYVRYVRFVTLNNGATAAEKRSRGDPEDDGEALGIFEGLGMQFFWDKSKLQK